MKIIKMPCEKIIKHYCGCEFEWDTEDINGEVTYVPSVGDDSLLQYITEYYVVCPFCKEKVILRKKTDENPSD